MTTELIPSGQHTYSCTIALLPGTEEEAFETRMVTEIMPRMFVSRRNFRVLDLEHLLLKADNSRRADKYVWQIRILEFAMVSQRTDIDRAFEAIDEDVRLTLRNLGIVTSATSLREIGSTQTP